MDHRNRSRAEEWRETGEPPGASVSTFDDATLLLRYAQERDEEAFAELVRRYLDGVYASALRRVGGDAHLAQDVAQQVFVALARRSGSLAPGLALSGWLYTATRNVAGSLVRTERRRKAREQEAAIMEKILSPSAVDAPPDWSRVAPVLDSALDDLREPERQVVLWRFVDRRPFSEIGAALRVTEDAARMRVDRALEKLRVGLARRGISSTSTALGVALAQNIAAAAPVSLASLITQSALVATPLAAGGYTLLLLQTMAQAKLTSVVAAGVALFALGTATYQVAVHRQAEARLATDMRAYAALVARQRALEARTLPSDAASQRPALPAPLPSAAPLSGGAVQAAPGAGWDPKAEGRALLKRHPELREAMMATLRANLEIEYESFFRAQGLTPLQIADFTAIQAAGYRFSHPMSDGRLYELALGDGSDAAEVRRVLGEEGYRNLQAFDDESNLRWVASRLARDLGFSAAPLAPAQAGQLKEIMARHRPKDVFDVTAYAWPAIFAEAEVVLRPVQLAALGRLVAEEQASRAAEKEAHP